MIASFFRSLEVGGVEYLLISGQASVLYGAATFSEDIDLWVDPTAGNCERFTTALRACRARHYKLTPPLAVEPLRRGHGFHYVLGQGSSEEIFLDVLGMPPRVGAFRRALRSARWMETGWGRLPVVALRDLVELKKTQRLEDYAVISRLAGLWLDQPDCRRRPGDVRWAWENLFSLPELQAFVERHPLALQHFPSGLPAAVLDFARRVSRAEDAARFEESVSRWLQSRVVPLQKADRDYWRPIIAELRRFHREGLLVPEGRPV